MSAPPAPPGNVPITIGNAGDDVGLVGHGFGPVAGTVRVGTVSATVTAWTDTFVQVTLPAQADFLVTTTVTLTRADGKGTTLPAFSTDTFSLAAHISSLSAAGGPAGLSLTITGTHFEATRGTGGVTIHGVAAAVTSWGDTSIVVVVPAQASYPDTGNVVVTTGEGSVSNGVSFETVPDPVITSINHATSQPGDSLILTGTKFLASQGTGSVTVDGVAAAVTSWADTSVTVTVPSQGGTSASYPVAGNVALTTSLARTSNTKAHTTTVPNPVIASLNHANGQPGDTLTLTGTFFGASQGAGSVSVDSAGATVTSWAETAVTVTVPSQGGTSASYPVAGTVVLTTNGALTSNGSSYTTTVPNPVLASLSAGTGQAGSALTLTGTFFGASQGGSGGVTVHGSTATVTSWAESSVAITVPTFGSYPDTGNVVLTTDGLLQSNGISFITTSAYALKGAGFEGSNTRILRNLTNAAALTPAQFGDFSAAAWFKLSSGGGWIMGQGTFGNGRWQLDVDAADGKPEGFAFDNTNALQAKAKWGTAMRDGAWHLLVFTYNGAGAGATFVSVDGGTLLAGQSLGSGLSGYSTTFEIGNRNDVGLIFAGDVDEAALWKGRVLNQTDVGLLWNGGAGLTYSDLTGGNAGLLTNLTEWWTLNEAANATRAGSKNGYDLLDISSNVLQVTGIK